ncbi:hypothetical protein [Parasitella parasitica]|uniref:Transcription activator GCR1-like domain-containing protein n=1 Tax=Parasitella parasitica TaxID=35722 RepID=A0A0B7NQF3_9FUNG|nr:hypothetical protein [Parasitella parasitica]
MIGLNNQNEENRVACYSRAYVEENKPKNTNAAYAPQQMQYEEFCRENGYPDFIVTEERVLRFIDMVAKRGNPARPRGDGSNFGDSYHNLAQYLSAMVDLHKKQRNDPKTRHLNMNLVLRGPAIKQLDQRLEIECRINNANDLKDPGENSIQDGYTFEQMILIGILDVNSEHYTICGADFLHLLKKLHVIILQDAVLLRQQNSKSLVWMNKIFKSQEFEASARDSLQAMATAQVPSALDIRRTMPFVAERFGQIQHVLAAQAKQAEQLFTASAAPANNDLASQLAAINANVTSLRSEIQAMNSRFTSARVIDGGRVTFEQAQPSTPTPTANEEAQSSSMKSPNHNSVQDLWDEWTKGMNDHPSIRDLNTKYGTE